MNISHAFANSMGASADIIYIILSHFRITYPDLFVGFHDLLNACQGQLLLLEVLQVVLGQSLYLVPDLFELQVQLLDALDVLLVLLRGGEAGAVAWRVGGRRVVSSLGGEGQLLLIGWVAFH